MTELSSYCRTWRLPPSVLCIDFRPGTGARARYVRQQNLGLLGETADLNDWQTGYFVHLLMMFRHLGSLEVRCSRAVLARASVSWLIGCAVLIPFAVAQKISIDFDDKVDFSRIHR